MEKWKEIESFQFGKLEDSYGFETRLVTEQKWSLLFTEKAIIEYKKFMYLASTANQMVSPSKIVDEVWHLHLIYTQSYQDFCKLLGKRIEHIPSNHNEEEKEMFDKAQEKTFELYLQTFNEEPPSDIWKLPTFLSTIPSSKYQVQLRYGLVLSIIFSAIFYYAFSAVYKEIKGLYFIPVFLILFLVGKGFAKYQMSINSRHFLSSLKEYNLSKLFHPVEWGLIYSKSNRNPLDFYLNKLFETENIEIKDKKISYISSKGEHDKLSLQILKVLKKYKSIDYKDFLNKMDNNAYFFQMKSSSNLFRKKLKSSSFFANQKLMESMVYFGILAFALGRLITGIVYEKEVFFLAILLIFYLIYSYYQLITIENRFTRLIPDRITNEINIEGNKDRDWRWNSFFGDAALLIALNPIVPAEMRSYNRNQSADSSSSCGGGCGSSCGGGGCGGCGS